MKTYALLKSSKRDIPRRYTAMVLDSGRNVSSARTFARIKGESLELYVKREHSDPVLFDTLDNGEINLADWKLYEAARAFLPDMFIIDKTEHYHLKNPHYTVVGDDTI